MASLRCGELSSERGRGEPSLQRTSYAWPSLRSSPPWTPPFVAHTNGFFGIVSEPSQVRRRAATTSRYGFAMYWVRRDRAWLASVGSATTACCSRSGRGRSWGSTPDTKAKNGALAGLRPALRSLWKFRHSYLTHDLCRCSIRLPTATNAQTESRARSILVSEATAGHGDVAEEYTVAARRPRGDRTRTLRVTGPRRRTTQRHRTALGRVGRRVICSTD